MAKDLRTRFLIAPGSKVRLRDADAADTAGRKDVDHADAVQDRNVSRISELQQKLWASGRTGVVIVLQGMDTSGKDGTIRHLLTGVNPQGVRVVSFKAPTPEELRRDYLWRVHACVPARGEIGVFNRSHYEDVLVPFVHGTIDKAERKRRHRQINDFERHMSENGYVLVKCMLHISKDEQRRRLQERLDDPSKNWKMALSDLDERKRWAEYIKAYEQTLGETSTAYAPWHVIPSDRKWFRNLAISEIVVGVLRGIDPEYPKPSFDASNIRVV
jgi:PPK2 family polyphosphate:nucleotide phosphotransferase